MIDDRFYELCIYFISGSIQEGSVNLQVLIGGQGEWSFLTCNVICRPGR